MADCDGGLSRIPILTYLGNLGKVLEVRCSDIKKLNLQEGEYTDIEGAFKEFESQVIIPFSRHEYEISGQWERGRYVFNVNEQRELEISRIERYSHNIG